MIYDIKRSVVDCLIGCYLNPYRILFVLKKKDLTRLRGRESVLCIVIVFAMINNEGLIPNCYNGRAG